MFFYSWIMGLWKCGKWSQCISCFITWYIHTILIFFLLQLSYQLKVGIMYCKAGQSTEEEMYNNESAGPAFEEFLQLLGERVRLKGFDKYRAQLDTKSKTFLFFFFPLKWTKYLIWLLIAFLKRVLKNNVFAVARQFLNISESWAHV